MSFAALADPTRRAILDLLRDDPQPVGELVGALRMNQPAVSKHLRVLRDAGLVRVTVDAQRRIYSLDLQPLRELDAWLAPYRERWTTALDRLDQHLEDHP